MIERSEFWLTRARLIECTAICQSQCCWTALDSGQQVIGHAYDKSENTFVYDVYRFTDSSENIKTCCELRNWRRVDFLKLSRLWLSYKMLISDVWYVMKASYVAM